MYLHICTTYKRANGRQANQYTHTWLHSSTSTHTDTHTHTYHKTPVINDAFPPLSFFSRDNSANRRSTSCPMSLKAPAACEFAGDWWRLDRKRREFLTKVSPLEIFNGHIDGTYIRPLRFWAMGYWEYIHQIWPYVVQYLQFRSLEISLKFHWNMRSFWRVTAL